MLTRKRRHPWIGLIILGLVVGVWAGRDLFMPAAAPIPTLPAPATQEGMTAAAPTDQPATSASTPQEEGEAVALLSIPRLNTSARVVERYLSGSGWDISLLGRNVGHLEGTSQLHGGGNTVLVGHVELSDGGGGPFRDLPNLEVGDKLILLVGPTSESYTVSEVYTTTPDDMNPLRPTTSPRLTLITCGEYDFIANVYQKRIIVVAEKI